MPEGDSIHRLARRLDANLRGQPIVGFETTVAKLLNADIVGRRITNVRSRGKHLLMDFDDGRLLHSHLLMSGRWRLVRRRPPLRERASVLLVTHRAMALGVRLGIVELLATETRSAQLRRLGPDLLSDQPDFAQMVSRLRHHEAVPLGEALMRQELVAGFGNVYKSELLFLERLCPFQLVSETSDESLTLLLMRGANLMRRNIGPGPRVTRRRFDGRHWVYRRAGEPCRVCAAAIEMRRQANRSTYYCPSCQTT